MIVYTCITGNKDNLVNVQPEPGVRYVCFTDQRRRHPVWEFVDVNFYGYCDPRRVARMYKILSHVWFPDEETIWVDGRIRLIRSPLDIASRYDGIVCARPHHSRKCIYKEANEVKRINYDNHAIVDDHISRIRNRKYPPDNGLHETGVLLRRPGCEEFNRLWWEQLSTGSKRDQLSFDFVAWKLGMTITKMDRNDVQVLRHRVPTNADR